MYAKRFKSKRFTPRRTGGTLTRRTNYAVRKVGRTVYKPRFATVSYNRNVEKKYFDKTYSGSSIEAQVGPIATATNNGFMYISNTWQTYNFANITVAPVTISNDMNKGLETGTTARTRVANKIKPIYYKGAMTFTAATLAQGKGNQNGESYGTNAGTGGQYLRTTFRMVIVKDLQVNSTDPQIKWEQVFETNTNLTAGIHSELNVDNMGRFIVLEDKYFTLDAENPQKTCPYMIKGSALGNVRYNGPSTAALTDKGIYILFAAYVMGTSTAVTTADVHLADPVGHSRLCFTDD